MAKFAHEPGMMRTFLLFPFLFLSVLLNAQITVTSADMPEVYHSYYSEIIADFALIDVSQTGTNQTWDFSGVLGVAQDTLYAAPVSATPLAYQFFFNNIILYPDYAADYAVPAPDLGATGVALTDRYEYFKSDSQGHKIVGFGANVQAVPTSVRYDVIDYIYDFPMAYGNNGSSNAEYLVTVPTFGAYGQWITRTKTVDGWGTVITPAGTYSCLRVQTILEQIDTVYADLVGFGFTTPRPTDTIYDWVANGEGIPVFSATVGTVGITNAYYKSGEINAIAEIDKQPVRLYPNPTNGMIYLETDRKGSYTIHNLAGRRVMNGSYSAFELIDLSLLNTGLYQLTLTSESGEHISRKIEVVK